MIAKLSDVEIAHSLFREIGEESLKKYFLNRLEEKGNPESRPLIISALTNLGGLANEEIIDLYANNLVETVQVRKAAVMALGQIAHKNLEPLIKNQLVEALKNLLDDNNIEISSCEASQLASI